jgi:pilus assembly protein CpaB
MNVARLSLLGVAVLAAGAAAFLMRSMTHREAKAKPAVIEAPASEVLVAAHALVPGAVLTPADLKWQKWPQEAVNDSYFTSKTAPRAAEDAAGAIVRAHVEPGEPLTRAKFVKAKDAGFMAAMLTPGMRAVSIKISEETSAGGFILPGDQVDVISTRKTDETSGARAFNSETVLENVRVLAIGQAFEPTGNDKTVVGKTATLELLLAQAELVAAAEAEGDLSLALRSAAQGELTGSISKPAPRASANIIRTLRYGHAGRTVPALTQASGGAP